ncbi:MAG: gliding motility lipoprotein GldH, partial [Muribaculaceae bacterium]|nr:gliding motility lipoprotein GldH [Muribaculaceae bacterium]
RSNLYSEYHRISEDGWRYGAEVFFTPVHSDSLCSGRFVVALRHDNTYPYTDIRLEVTHVDGGTELCDTIDIELAGRYGQWNGSGIGTSFQVADTLGRTVHPSGTMVRLRHLMRTDTLHGINQAGLFFVPD